MPQTLIALFAMMLMSTLSLQTTQSRYAAQTETMRYEVQNQARGIGLELLERVGRYDYDGGENGSSNGQARGSETGQSASNFTASNHFGADTTLAAGTSVETLFSANAIDDVDDFHGIRQALATRSVSVPGSATAGSIEFDVDFDVEYVKQVNGVWVESSSPTFQKRVNVEITHDLLPQAVTLSRIVATS